MAVLSPDTRPTVGFFRSTQARAPFALAEISSHNLIDMSPYRFCVPRLSLAGVDGRSMRHHVWAMHSSAWYVLRVPDAACQAHALQISEWYATSRLFCGSAGRRLLRAEVNGDHALDDAPHAGSAGSVSELGAVEEGNHSTQSRSGAAKNPGGKYAFRLHVRSLQGFSSLSITLCPWTAFGTSRLHLQMEASTFKYFGTT